MYLAMELAQQRRHELERAAAEDRRARARNEPREAARTLGTVVELTSSNPAATNRLLIAHGAQVVEHDESAGRVRTVLAPPARDHFWVVVGEEQRTA
jgi:hypothetical protein